jgi:glycosyltransferase involved in cell wall biosynthesis
MFGWELPPKISGGLGVACAGLLSGLKNSGQVSVNFNMPQLLATRLTAAQLDSLTGLLGDYIASGAMVGAASAGGGGSYTANVTEALSFALAVPEVLAEHGPFNIIHCHDWLTFLAGVAAKRATGLPLVLHMHSTERDRAGWTPNDAIVDIERYALAHADAVIAVSQNGARRVIATYGVREYIVHTIYNATRQLAVAGQRLGGRPMPVISFIGRITAQKGPLYFVEAAQRVQAAGVACRFVMAGAGDLLPACQALVLAHGLAELFEFPGFLDAAGVSALLTRTDVFVMPSESEPFGIAALEAIHAGVPVVISENSGVTEVVESMLKVVHDDVDAIAEAIIRLVSDTGLARTMAEQALYEAARLSWDSAGLLTVAVYRDLLDFRNETYVGGGELVKQDTV